MVGFSWFFFLSLSEVWGEGLMENSYEKRFFNQWFFHPFLSDYWLREIHLHVLGCLGLIFHIVPLLPLWSYKYVCQWEKISENVLWQVPKSEWEDLLCITLYKLLSGLRKRNVFMYIHLPGGSGSLQNACWSPLCTWAPGESRTWFLWKAEFHSWHMKFSSFNVVSSSALPHSVQQLQLCTI